MIQRKRSAFQGARHQISVHRYEGKGALGASGTCSARTEAGAETMSKGEFTSVAQANGGLENMINWDGKDKDTLAPIKYIADEDKLEKILENPQVIKTPVVRNGKQSTIGYQPDIWKKWN